jgi:hypothetical protein
MKAAIVKKGGSTQYVKMLYGDIFIFNIREMSLKEIVATIKREGIEKVGIDDTLDSKSKEYLRRRLLVGCEDVKISELEEYSSKKCRDSALWVTTRIINGQTDFSVKII